MQDSYDTNYEGVEVIIRLKPILFDPNDPDTRCCVSVYPTEDNTVVVETPNKKEYFSFDHVAGQQTQQQQIYDFIGKPVLDEGFKGFNCCIFAYGQTGAGKTHSILGNASELTENSFAESRGILPRLLEDLFFQQRTRNSRTQVNCSYLQIYNQQIIDLLNKEIKVYPIRQDFKRGVYVEGLSEESLHSYEQSIQCVFKGLKNRKVASTSMNSESSRSHSIFTINLKMTADEEGTQITRTSKIHIVDLAGSERQRQANVSGERLKEGCNINRSLHCLGNVINSLVESIKKKKYIPFRDSKLTFFLKDSLGGNSKTKLLANINPRKQYLGDTISTLMFAKRVKILKTRVEPNQNVADNFQALRSQIRKLREELAQTKFIKNPFEVSKIEEIEAEDRPQLKLTDSSLNVDGEAHKMLELLSANQNQFRVLIQTYIQRIQKINLGSQNKIEGNYKQLFEQKRLLERQNASYAALIVNFPAFTKIFKENLDMRRKIKRLEGDIFDLQRSKQEIGIELQKLTNNVALLKEEKAEIEQEMVNLKAEVDNVISEGMNNDPKADHSAILPLLELSRLQDQATINMTKRQDIRDMISKQNTMLEDYETCIQEVKDKFKKYIEQLQQSYQELQKKYEHDKEEWNNLRKMKRPQQPADVETLEDENQYYKLNIMDLENEIGRYQQQVFKNNIEIKTLTEENDNLRHEIAEMKEQQQNQGFQESYLLNIIGKLREIKHFAERQQREVDSERDQEELTYNQLREKLLKVTNQNTTLAARNHSLTEKCRNLKKRNGDALKSGFQVADEVSLEEETEASAKLIELRQEISTLVQQKNSLLKELEEQSFKNSEDRAKMEKASMKILSLSKEVAWLKQQNNHEVEDHRLIKNRIEQMELAYDSLKQKHKVTEIEHNRLRKELDRKEQFTHKVKNQLNKTELELFQGYRLLESQVEHLKTQILKVQRESMNKSKTTGFTSSSRSLKSVDKDHVLTSSTIEPFSTKPTTQSTFDKKDKQPKSAEKRVRTNTSAQKKEVVESEAAKAINTEIDKGIGVFSKVKRSVNIQNPPVLPTMPKKK